MKLPKDEVVRFVLRKALAQRAVHSQVELTKLVNAELRKVDSEHAVSGSRIRRLTTGMPVVVRVLTKKGAVPKSCPSCGGRLRKILSKTLTGRTLMVGMKCPRCPYKGMQDKFAPSRYEFRMKS